MHFSKTYAQILQELPPDLRENAIQYRQLKKLINRIVSELSSLGLSPTVLQELINEGALSEEANADTVPKNEIPAEDAKTGLPRIAYELVEHSDRIEPHLRLWVDVPDGVNVSTDANPLSPQEEDVEEEKEDKLRTEEEKKEMRPTTNVLWSLHQILQERHPDSPVEEVASTELAAPGDAGLDSTDAIIPQITSPGVASHGGQTREVIIPLASDTEFFNNLITALEGMSTHMQSVNDDFTKNLRSLSTSISDSALPASASSSFIPHSAVTSHPGSIMVSTMQPRQSDLYSWREIFQLYVEAEIFEHVGEVNHGQHSVEESEKRLQLFVQQATQRGLADRSKFKSKQSRRALQNFIELNLFILNIKKFSEASSEATRKILKKHTKRTALPLSLSTSTTGTTTSSVITTGHLSLLSRLSNTALPRTLVQAIGETLLPVIPHVDDYACLICTAIAFKPIRLNCGHLFCVRCLVKMQKRGQADCPLCRAPVVLSANKSNVDWALLNFMQDWFPVESREKLKANEREASREELEELGLDPDKTCVVM
ncbi:hypothetical protein H1R20_g9717, partial [Candolleomyces eurysporus]